MNMQIPKNIIDWNIILESLNDEVEKNYKNIDENFNFTLMENIKWSEFKIFNDKLDNFFNFINYESYDNRIIKINPGKCVPLHSLNSGYDNNTKIINCFITDPMWGHTVALTDSVLYNIKKNTVHYWNNKDDYHFAANCGTKNFYILQFAGYKKD